VWRTAGLERVQQVREGRRVFAQNVFENELLQLRIVDSDRSAADLKTVEDDVVVEAADFERIGVDEVKVFRVRLSERVVS
jgi:hypothetical protein